MKVKFKVTGHKNYNGDYHIQNFHFGRHIVGYTFENHALKLNFRPYIRRYTSPNENFEYSYRLNISLLVGQSSVDKSFAICLVNSHLCSQWLNLVINWLINHCMDLVKTGLTSLDSHF